MPQILVWKPCRTVSSAKASRVAPNPAANMPALAARYCRRVMVLIARSSVTLSLFLLQVELADALRNVVRCLCDHLSQLLRRGRYRDGTGLLDHAAVFGRADDRGDPALQQIQDRGWRARAGADSEPAETQ